MLQLMATRSCPTNVLPPTGNGLLPLRVPHNPMRGVCMGPSASFWQRSRRGGRNRRGTRPPPWHHTSSAVQGSLGASHAVHGHHCSLHSRRAASACHSLDSELQPPGRSHCPSLALSGAGVPEFRGHKAAAERDVAALHASCRRPGPGGRACPARSAPKRQARDVASAWGAQRASGAPGRAPKASGRPTLQCGTAVQNNSGRQWSDRRAGRPAPPVARPWPTPPPAAPDPSHRRLRLLLGGAPAWPGAASCRPERPPVRCGVTSCGSPTAELPPPPAHGPASQRLEGIALVAQSVPEAARRLARACLETL